MSSAAVFERYQRALEKRDAALAAYRKAESDFIAADREHNDAKRDWYSDLLKREPAPHVNR